MRNSSDLLFPAKINHPSISHFLFQFTSQFYIHIHTLAHPSVHIGEKERRQIDWGTQKQANTNTNIKPNQSHNQQLRIEQTL